LSRHFDPSRRRDVVGNRLAKVGKTWRGTVSSPPFIERLLRRLLHVRRRREVRLPDLEMDDVLALGLERTRLLQHLEGGLDPDSRHSFCQLHNASISRPPAAGT